MTAINEEERIEAVVPQITEWYQVHHRALPWRENSTPYHVWISEIMLQQTRIEAVIPYYARFLDVLPQIADLAAVSEDELLKLWEGLGYYSRARNLKKTAQILVDRYGGNLPANASLLRELPGIGDYTAGAIASIAFGLPEPAVDGNVLRVITRLLCDTSDVLKPATKNRITEYLRRHYPKGEEASRLTQGIMEIGEQVCIPSGEPRCDACPLFGWCLAREEKRTPEIPVRAPKPARRTEERTVFLLRCGDCYAIRKREDKGLLAGTFEFPNIEGHLSSAEAEAYVRSFGINPVKSEKAPNSKHIFSHVEWHMKGMSFVCEAPTGPFLWLPPEEICRSYAFASAFRAYSKEIVKRKQEAEAEKTD